MLVIKPQRIGGIAAALRAAELAGVPVVVSSALETSVGLAACLAVAAALPDLALRPRHRHRHPARRGRHRQPARPVHGRLAPRRVEPDLLLVRRR